MFMFRFPIPFVVWFLLVASLTLPVWAAPTAAQRRERKALMTQLIKAGALYNQGKYEDSGKVIQQVLERTEKLLESADRDLIQLVKPVYRRLVHAHALLELEGIELPALKKLEAATKPTSKQISFTQDVAPLLVSKCGRCHVAEARGEVSIGSYASMMRGSRGRVLVAPRDPTASRMVQVIEEGDMPRGGGSLSTDELQTLKDWIQQGAKFDGQNQASSLNTYASNGGSQAQPQVSIVKSTGAETVSFSRDIAPILGDSCIGCHINGRRPRGRFNMSTFSAFVRGGDSGPAIAPGKPAQSLLVQRLKGEGGGPRMPAGGRTPLTAEMIAKIEKWIAEGATFDGPDPEQNVIELTALTRAREATHEQLSADRIGLARRNWQLGMGQTPYVTSETDNFFLLGNVGQATLAQLGRRAEALTPTVAKLLGASSKKVLLKGRLTVFVFKQRYDYSEFGQMVEKRPLPKSWRGHWRYTVVDAYAGILQPPHQEEDDAILDVLVGQQVAGAYIASLGTVPRWFSEGTARAVAASLEPRDSRVLAWDAALSGVLGSMSRADDFLKGRLSAEDAEVASYSYVRFLRRDLRRFNRLLGGVENGGTFEREFANAYGADPSAVAQAWARYVVAQARRRR